MRKYKATLINGAGVVLDTKEQEAYDASSALIEILKADWYLVDGDKIRIEEIDA